MRRGDTVWFVENFNYYFMKKTIASFVCPDGKRYHRQGIPEGIYCPGKTISQIIEIARKLRQEDKTAPILLTRAEVNIYRAVKKIFRESHYNLVGKIIHIPSSKKLTLTDNYICVITAGTTDVPVAEEAAETASSLGIRVKKFYDVGVAGIHRIMDKQKEIANASCSIVCAGMEGALPSVVGGLAASPVIAVPTSVGYGANFGGVSALLTMLNSCAPNVCVVNIDDGFGAGVTAALIARKK